MTIPIRKLRGVSDELAAKLKERWIVYTDHLLEAAKTPAGRATAQLLLGETPTVPSGTVTPVPVGGHLTMVDRGAVLQANLGQLIVPLAALVIIIGIVGAMVIRRRPMA